eukprot:TRINITY_DN44697_c0_g1_i1.p1 TRINITY_DN44697_c0_g1~~TRINITY_DN44697_c0_g1_i1.p1  ORF type:complete len:108 (+),score=8.67 TRINITY_DN44697_c0_g1_i1:122-445(+)
MWPTMEASCQLQDRDAKDDEDWPRHCGTVQIFSTTLKYQQRPNVFIQKAEASNVLTSRACAPRLTSTFSCLSKTMAVDKIERRLISACCQTKICTDRSTSCRQTGHG